MNFVVTVYEPYGDSIKLSDRALHMAAPVTYVQAGKLCSIRLLPELTPCSVMALY